MNSSERITVIREISRILGQEEWDILDLTLRQFKLPTSNEWQGDKPAYVVAMIDNAKDSQLIGLADHLGISISQDLTQTANYPFWKPNYFRLFISHVTKSKSTANDLKNSLSQYHVSAFVAHSDIEPTRQWMEQIEGALATADALLAILTEGFHESLWTDQEVGVAIGRSILIVPMRLGLDPYGLFGKLQAISGYNKDSEARAKEIIEVLIKNKKTTRKITYSLVDSLFDSPLYKFSMELMSLIETSDYLDPILAARMRDSIKNNNSVASAYGVPEHIEALISKRIAK